MHLVRMGVLCFASPLFGLVLNFQETCSLLSDENSRIVLP